MGKFIDLIQVIYYILVMLFLFAVVGGLISGEKSLGYIVSHNYYVTLILLILGIIILSLNDNKEVK